MDCDDKAQALPASVKSWHPHRAFAKRGTEACLSLGRSKLRRSTPHTRTNSSRGGPWRFLCEEDIRAPPRATMLQEQRKHYSKRPLRVRKPITYSCRTMTLTEGTAARDRAEPEDAAAHAWGKRGLVAAKAQNWAHDFDHKSAWRKRGGGAKTTSVTRHSRSFVM